MTKRPTRPTKTKAPKKSAAKTRIESVEIATKEGIGRVRVTMQDDPPSYALRATADRATLRLVIVNTRALANLGGMLRAAWSLPRSELIELIAMSRSKAKTLRARLRALCAKKSKIEEALAAYGKGAQ